MPTGGNRLTSWLLVGCRLLAGEHCSQLSLTLGRLPPCSIASSLGNELPVLPHCGAGLHNAELPCFLPVCLQGSSAKLSKCVAAQVIPTLEHHIKLAAMLPACSGAVHQAGQPARSQPCAPGVQAERAAMGLDQGGVLLPLANLWPLAVSQQVLPCRQPGLACTIWHLSPAPCAVRTGLTEAGDKVSHNVCRCLRPCLPCHQTGGQPRMCAGWRPGRRAHGCHIMPSFATL